MFRLLIDPSFQKANRRFVLTFDVNGNRLGCSRYYLLVDGRNFFDQAIENNIKT